MATMHAYLKFPGTAEETFKFYRSVFGTEFLALIRYKDNAGEASKLSNEEKEKIFFIALLIGNGTTIMATDVLEPLEDSLIVGNNYSVYIGADSKEEGEHIFRKLSVDATIEVPFQKQPWGAHFGSLKDKFGVPWIINFQETLGPLTRRP